MAMKSIQSILIPTDYSVNANRAARMGVALAKDMGAEVFIFHSFGLPVIGVAESIAIADDIKHTEGKKLDKYLGELKTEFGDVKIHGILEFGSAVDWMQKIVSAKKIDLIVMGTKGQTDATGVVFGSVASHVVNNVDCPVLIIPQGCRNHTISEILFATDFHFSNNLATCVSPLLTIIKEYDPFVHVAHFTHQRVAEGHQKNTEELKLYELLRDSKHSFHYVEAEDTELALLEFADKHHCDLIVVVTRHYSLWEKIFHRSLTRKLALHAEKPMLVLHEK